MKAEREPASQAPPVAHSQAQMSRRISLPILPQPKGDVGALQAALTGGATRDDEEEVEGNEGKRTQRRKADGLRSEPRRHLIDAMHVKGR